MDSILIVVMKEKATFNFSGKYPSDSTGSLKAIENIFLKQISIEKQLKATGRYTVVARYILSTTAD